VTRAARILATASVAFVALAVGCGGSDKAGAPPATPAFAPSEYPEATPGQPPPPPPSAETPAAAGGSTGGQVQAALVQARAELDEADRELQTSAGDCAAACRALASMERAAGRLCSLAVEPDDRRRCDDARRKVREARDRVRQTCNTCPGGPSLDPNAPIPSTSP
jgi:hypothetical protein